MFEVRNLIEISEAIARSALAREESRGAHSRLDHPETKASGRRRTSSSAARARRWPYDRAHPAMPDDLRALAEAGGAH